MKSHLSCSILVWTKPNNCIGAYDVLDSAYKYPTFQVYISVKFKNKNINIILFILFQIKLHISFYSHVRYNELCWVFGSIAINCTYHKYLYFILCKITVQYIRSPLIYIVPQYTIMLHHVLLYFDIVINNTKISNFVYDSVLASGILVNAFTEQKQKWHF